MWRRHDESAFHWVGLPSRLPVIKSLLSTSSLPASVVNVWLVPFWSVMKSLSFPSAVSWTVSWTATGTGPVTVVDDELCNSVATDSHTASQRAPIRARRTMQIFSNLVVSFNCGISQRSTKFFLAVRGDFFACPVATDARLFHSLSRDSQLPASRICRFFCRTVKAASLRGSFFEPGWPLGLGAVTWLSL